jgi:hypothetical protein
VTFIVVSLFGEGAGIEQSMSSSAPLASDCARSEQKEVQFSSVQLRSVQRGSVQFREAQFSSVQFSSERFSSERFR